MHRDHIQSPDAHLPIHIQIELLFVQIGVFGQIKFILCLRDFVVPEILTRCLRHFLLCGRLNHPLLLLQDRFALSVGQLPDQLGEVVLRLVARAQMAAQQVCCATLVLAPGYNVARTLTHLKWLLFAHSDSIVLVQKVHFCAASHRSAIGSRGNHRILVGVHQTFLD